MKKKLNAILAMLLCVACLPVMPLNANAEEETLGDYNDPLTVETDLFTYNHGLLTCYQKFIKICKNI